MWYEWKRQDMSEDEMYQEYPATPEQAFISTQAGVFDTQKIIKRYNNLPPH